MRAVHRDVSTRTRPTTELRDPAVAAKRALNPVGSALGLANKAVFAPSVK